MAQYKVVLRELATNCELVRCVSVAYEVAALCAALGGYGFPFTREKVRHARHMAGVYEIKPPDQRYQLVSIERLDDAFPKPRRWRKVRIPDGANGDVDKFFVERNEYERR